MNTDKTKCFKVFAYPCLSAFIRGQNAFWRQLRIMNSSLTGKTILVTGALPRKARASPFIIGADSVKKIIATDEHG